MTYVLVHGLGLSATIWNRLIPFFDDEVIAIDLPGHGNSGSTEFSWTGILRAVKDAVGAKDWSEITLVLHSFTACLLPDLILFGISPAKIILVEGVLHPSDASWSNKITFLNDVQFENWLIGFRQVSEIALRSQLISRQNKEDLEIWSDSFKTVNGRALRVMAKNLRDRLHSSDLNRALKLINTKILYLRGGCSRLSQDGKFFLVNNSILIEEMPNCGHFPMIDNPESFVDMLVNSYI